MADDLIPPPSPAGRPQPDAMAAVRGADPAASEPPAPEGPPGPVPAPFRGRFGFVWGVLTGVAVCAAAVTVALVTAPSDSGPRLAANWSSWKPSTSRMLAGAQDIAEHVARKYKLGSGEQLVTVRSSRIELAGEPLGVAVRPKGGELQVLEGDGLMYLLATLDPSKPLARTRATERLLRREALELALYSFRYLDDVTMVAVVLPPTSEDEGDDEAQSRAVFYRPGDLVDQLQVPLARTLSVQSEVDSLALRHLFNFSIQPLDSDLDYLVLAEPDVVR